MNSVYSWTAKSVSHVVVVREIEEEGEEGEEADHHGYQDSYSAGR